MSVEEAQGMIRLFHDRERMAKMLFTSYKSDGKAGYGPEGYQQWLKLNDKERKRWLETAAMIISWIEYEQTFYKVIYGI